MADWLNHAAVAAARNGTADHTVAPDGTGGTVVAGSGFAASSGRLLLVFVDGAVTSTTPSGWTLPTNGSAINNSGLYVFYKTAAGSDSVVTTHNGSNYPAIFDFYEFPVGSTFVAAEADNTVAAAGGNEPLMSGLTGTNWTAGIVGQANGTGGTNSFTWDLGVEAVDTSVASSGTDGYTYSLTYTDDNASATAQYAATGSNGTGVERLVVAVLVAASSPGVFVEFVKVIT